MNQPNTLSSEVSSCSGTCEDGGTASAVRPEYRVDRRDQGVSLRLALPGVPKDKVEISLEQGLLTVSAERQQNTPENWKPHTAPAHPGRYRLAVRLHPDLDPSTIAAKLSDGILTLDIERHEAARPRSIEVN